MIKKVFVILIIVLFSAEGFSQADDKDLIQFSGVIVHRDSLYPVPFAAVMIKNTRRGTISDYYGFFSFVARMRDTIEFSSIGFRKSHFIIPDTLKENRYSLIQVLVPDTIQLKEAVIYPWPTKEQFKQAFLRLNVPDDDLVRAKRNLEKEQLQEVAVNLPADGSLTFKYTMEQRYSRLYTAGQLPKNNLLNPIAWSQFIQAWKNGDFKQKDN